MANLDNELNWLVDRIKASPARLYVEAHESFGIVSLTMPYRTLQVGQTAVGQESRTFRCALAPDLADRLADQLRAAAESVRQQAEIGDH